MLYAKRHGDAVLHRYHDAVFERFWKRELDIEDPAVIGDLLAEAGADTADFPVYLAGEGRQKLDRICRDAEEAGASVCRALSSTASCSGVANT
jgi:predicted DsbA family dithiol-disulfide isomerase